MTTTPTDVPERDAAARYADAGATVPPMPAFVWFDETVEMTPAMWDALLARTTGGLNPAMPDPAL